MALTIWLVPEDLNNRSFFVQILIIFPFLFCPVMVVMMTLGAFGREFSLGTFSMLMAQPVTRARIWWTKTLLLASAVLLVWFVWCISYILHRPGYQVTRELQDMEIWAALFALAIFSGGLWTALLFRQMAAGSWFAVLAPAALLVFIENVILADQPDKLVERVLIATFIAYGVAGFIFARWRFSRVQDAQWTGGDVAMPEIRGGLFAPSNYQKAIGFARRDYNLLAPAPRRCSAKEFQLHQSQFLMAGVLVLLHLGVIATRKFGDFKGYANLKDLNRTFLDFVVRDAVFCWGCAPPSPRDRSSEPWKASSACRQNAAHNSG